MHYVKHFNINGIDTKQVACIELNGKPNAATEGAVGVLGIDITSPTHDVYKCVAVNGSIYTWELLSAGMSIINAKITGEGGASMTFPYSDLVIPNNYLIKIGDLILDSEAYLYQISTIGTSSCTATYCGTHIGGIASGDKDYSLNITENGQLQLLSESGRVISTFDYMLADNETITRDSTGKASVRGICATDGTFLTVYKGENLNDYYDLSVAQRSTMLPVLLNTTTGKLVVDEARSLSTNVVSGGSIFYASNYKTYFIRFRPLNDDVDRTLVLYVSHTGRPVYSSVSHDGYYCEYDSTNSKLRFYDSSNTEIPFENISYSYRQV